MKTTKLTFTLFLFSFVFLTSAFAQVKEKPEAKVDEKTELNRPNSIEADGEKVTIKDGTTTMVEFVSQGSSGLIHLPSLGTLVSYPGNNLYSSGTDLYWGSSKLGTSGSAAGWTDSGTNIYNTTLTDNVGIGTNNPLSKLSVGGDGSDEIVISAFTSNASGGIGVYGYSATDSQIGVSGYNNSTGIE
ncbi:MAG: hypothetical protein H6613_15915 [Ignavibacteriales bacterium]|nr:hypothetical protein [Ignavibacteriales bacterium]